MSERPDPARPLCECTCGRRGCVSVRRSGVVSHGKGGYNLGCRCPECLSGHASWTTTQKKRANSETLPGATKHRQQWTSAELEIATRADLSAKEAAALLNRSFSAVRNARARCLTDPKYIALLGDGKEARS